MGDCCTWRLPLATGLPPPAEAEEATTSMMPPLFFLLAFWKEGDAAPGLCAGGNFWEPALLQPHSRIYRHTCFLSHPLRLSGRR